MIIVKKPVTKDDQNVEACCKKDEHYVESFCKKEIYM